MLIRTGGHELAADEVHGATALTGVGRGDLGAAAHGAGEAHRAHQARHGTTRHADAVPPQLRQKTSCYLCGRGNGAP